MMRGENDHDEKEKRTRPAKKDHEMRSNEGLMTTNRSHLEWEFPMNRPS